MVCCLLPFDPHLPQLGSVRWRVSHALARLAALGEMNDAAIQKLTAGLTAAYEDDKNLPAAVSPAAPGALTAAVKVRVRSPTSAYAKTRIYILRSRKGPRAVHRGGSQEPSPRITLSEDSGPPTQACLALRARCVRRVAGT